MAALSNSSNFGDILNELAEYVTDVDVDIARASIRNVGRIANKLDVAADEAIEHLLNFLELNMDYVSTEAVIALKDLLRKYPERHEEVIPSLTKCLKNVEETEGKEAAVWMIGEYGDTIDDAPYILEPMIDGFGEEPSHAVRSELLTASMKLFFKRPPEMHKMLGKVLKAAVDDVSKVDVRDRALLYYRLLQLDVHEAARVVNCPKVVVEQFDEGAEAETKEKIFMEFNSLCAIYNKPSEKFVKYVPPEEEEEEEPAGAVAPEPVQEPLSPTRPDEPYQAPAAAAEMDLFGGATEPASPVASPGLVLDSNPAVDANTFQVSGFGLLKTHSPITFAARQRSHLLPYTLIGFKRNSHDLQVGWGSLPVVQEVRRELGPNPAQASIEQAFAAKNIMCMASGDQNGHMKFYFFATLVHTNCYPLRIFA